MLPTRIPSLELWILPPLLLLTDETFLQSLEEERKNFGETSEKRRGRWLDQLLRNYLGREYRDVWQLRFARGRDVHQLSRVHGRDVHSCVPPNQAIRNICRIGQNEQRANVDRYGIRVCLVTQRSLRIIATTIGLSSELLAGIVFSFNLLRTLPPKK